MADKPIPFVDLAFKYAPLAARFHQDLDRVLSSGSFILGEELARFEAAVTDFTGAPHAVGVGNGTDALMLCLKAMGIGPGDEVVTSPMSYLATASSIALCGATAVFADVDDGLNLDPERIEDALSPRTKAIMVVHLAGIPARIADIVDIADRHGLAVVEDCAQAFGARLHGRPVGTFGRFGAVSFHPLKNLGTLGDGGLILARNPDDARWLRQARNHGHNGRDACDFWSVNSRLDELHAAFLRTQLACYPQELRRRRRLAALYRAELAGAVGFPEIPDGGDPSYNWIMALVDRREELVAFLSGHGVETKVHYPLLLPSLKAAAETCRVHGDLRNARRQVARILSLPMAEHVSESDVLTVCGHVKEFCA